MSKKVDCCGLRFSSFIFPAWSKVSTIGMYCFVNKYLKIINQRSRISNILSYMPAIRNARLNEPCHLGCYLHMCLCDLFLSRVLLKVLWMEGHAKATWDPMVAGIPRWHHCAILLSIPPRSFPIFSPSLPFFLRRKVLSLASSSPDLASSNACAPSDAWICLMVLPLGSASWLLIIPVSSTLFFCEWPSW